MEATWFDDLPSRPCLREILGQGVRRLVRGGIPSARLDAEVLLSHALAMTREQLVVGAELPLRAEEVARFEALLLRRLQREPVAYITGRREFWSLDFIVTREVLIPRPETERLVEVALSLAGELPTDKPLRFLDIGTGTGAIAVSLAKELPGAQIWATDVSVAALAVARENARRHQVARQMTFLAGDGFAALGAGIAGFDLIVSNPPYIGKGEIAMLEPEVIQWEPHSALDGGTDGLTFYRWLAAQARQFINLPGAVAMEIGAAMGRQVSALFNQAGFYRDVAVIQDYAAKDRVVVAKSAADKRRSN